MVPDTLAEKREIYGVDFSGAADAGKRIWITKGFAASGRLEVLACARADNWLQVPTERRACLTALVDYVAQAGPSIFGFDFPFALPISITQGEDWQFFISAFARRFPDADSFRRDCYSIATRTGDGRKELKRQTEIETRAPWSAYNVRLYRQTFYGIRDVLSPLVMSNQACVLPITPAAASLPWLVEVCPACSLKRFGLYVSYKGRGEERRTARAQILGSLEKMAILLLEDANIRQIIVDDEGGDALDSALAAWAAWQALGQISAQVDHEEDYKVEGFVYG